jgi:hypothetical protein
MMTALEKKATSIGKQPGTGNYQKTKEKLLTMQN